MIFLYILMFVAGHFGRVYYGTMTEDDETMDVAVKTLQGL